MKWGSVLKPSAITQVIYFYRDHLFAGTSESCKPFATTAVMAVISMVWRWTDIISKLAFHSGPCLPGWQKQPLSVSRVNAGEMNHPESNLNLFFFFSFLTSRLDIVFHKKTQKDTLYQVKIFTQNMLIFHLTRTRSNFQNPCSRIERLPYRRHLASNSRRQSHGNTASSPVCVAASTLRNARLCLPVV